MERVSRRGLLACALVTVLVRWSSTAAPTSQPDGVYGRRLSQGVERSEPWDWRTVWPSRASSGSCRWARFAPPLHPPAERAPLNTSICLRPPADLLCDEVASRGYWPECADLPVLFERGGGSTGLFVDAGANVGACSLHMLLRTPSTSRIVAFEPSADSLFYFTSSLLRLQQAHADRRVAVYAGGERGESRAGAEVASASAPEQRLALHALALGPRDSPAQLLYQTVGNAGHAVVGVVPSAEWAPNGTLVPQSVEVATLDSVLWPAAAQARGEAPPRVSLLKLDVEGFECSVLRGMGALLRARVVRVIKVEVFGSMLERQGCSALSLQATLAAHGFTLHAPSAEGGLGPAVDPAKLHEREHGLPYNLVALLSDRAEGDGEGDAMRRSPPATGRRSRASRLHRMKLRLLTELEGASRAIRRASDPVTESGTGR